MADISSGPQVPGDAVANEPESPKTPKRKNYNADWDGARQWFIEGRLNPAGVRSYPSMRDIAKAINVHEVSVRRRSSQEKWRRQRELFQASLRNDTAEHVRKSMIREGAEFDKANLKICMALQSHVARLIQQATSDNKPLNTKTIKDLSTSLANLQRIGRLAMGQDTERSTTEHHIDLTRLSDEELAVLEAIFGPLAGPGERDESDTGGTPTTH